VVSDVDARLWWEGLKARYAGRAVVFDAVVLPEGIRLPAELFDSTADTLLENALYKVLPGVTLQVNVSLTAGPRMRICDNGSPVPKAIAQVLFRGPVPSESGLGVGLYQAAAFAEKSGYELLLAENREGSVCFELNRSS
jgi:K+-sensing histidine kinase KdpD